MVYIDIWTGSGCIPISVMKNMPHPNSPIKGEGASCFAIDISEQALAVAKINIQNHWLEGKIESLRGDLLEPLITHPNPLFKREGVEKVIISANLPYIKQNDFENMDESVYMHEPDTALYGWEKTGFELYEKLINQASILAKEGMKVVLFIEIWFDQKKVCENHLNTLGHKYEIFTDNGGVERCLKIEVE